MTNALAIIKTNFIDIGGDINEWVYFIVASV